jgi:hydrogenase nickel incorporation protein HypA/HybF
MHELAVTQSILDIACNHAEKAKAKSVDSIFLVIGQLSSIVDDSVQFYWDIITKDTICEHSKLNFKRIPAKLLCFDCNKEYLIESELIPCPICNGINIKVVSGEEFFLESIDITR